jgi:hypothetical protein
VFRRPFNGFYSKNPYVNDIHPQAEFAGDAGRAFGPDALQIIPQPRRIAARFPLAPAGASASLPFDAFYRSSNQPGRRKDDDGGDDNILYHLDYPPIIEPT